MNDWHFARIAARLIGAVPRGVSTVPPPPEPERDAGIVALRQALRARNHKHRRRTLLTIGGAATAIAVAAGFVVVMVSDRGLAPSAEPRADPSAPEQSIHVWGTNLPDGSLVRVGQLLAVHGSGSARLSFSGGTELRLAQESRIAVKAMGAVQRFRLGHGRLHAEVAPLEPGQRFLIETPDGEIEVHGTVFELGVVPSPSPCPVVTTTRLIVLRGVVEVRSAGRDDFIRAGQHWPPECDALAGLSGFPGPTAAASPFAESTASADGSATVAAPRPTHRDSASDSRAPAISASELTAQNDLFAAAMTAKRRGQTTRALDELSRLIQRFPGGPLVEAAHVERMRLYRQSGDGPSARRYAHEYLREFSNGFARAEAHLILGSTR